MILKWFDELGLAFRGLLLATTKRSFWPPFCITFMVFGTLINLLSNGFSSFNLMGASFATGDLVGVLRIIGSAFLGIFGLGKAFGDFFLNLMLILLQSILISLIFFVRRHNQRLTKTSSVSTKVSQNASVDGLESSALVAGLAVLGSGCPTCGTTLLAPVLGTILSGTSSAVAMAGTISLIINAIAIILAIFVFKRLGFMTYAIIKSERYTTKQEAHEKNP